jgi:hypothetical protein
MCVMKTLLLAAVLLATPASARDQGQWGDTDPAVRQWFQSLMQPDNPYVSCCGESDAYFADSYKVGSHGETIAIVTDERPDSWVDNSGITHSRPHIPVGTQVIIPDAKIKWDKGNPSGHGLIFIGASYVSTDGSVQNVYCYVPPGGV